MALTEGQKRKIQEEEEYRANLRKDQSRPAKKKTSIFTKIVLGLLIIFVGIPIGIGVLISFFTPSSNSSDTISSDSEVEKNTEFNAAVNFNGTQFVITNLDDYNCTGSRMSVNGKYSLDGYNLEVGRTYTVGAPEFTDGGNTRFNPFAIKPDSFSIICQSEDLHDYNTTSWTGRF